MSVCGTQARYRQLNGISKPHNLQYLLENVASKLDYPGLADENGIKMNSYFVQHPEMILGNVQMVSRRFGEEMSVLPYENADQV